jgi:predicted ATPase
MSDLLRLERIQIENYKSIEKCDVALQPITYLIGANGSGKSNFLDAIFFAGDVLHYGDQPAVSKRGGYNQILYQQKNHIQKVITIELLFPRCKDNRERYLYISEKYKKNAHSIFGIKSSDLDSFHLIFFSSFHNFYPEVIRQPQPSNTNEILAYDGSNLCSVLKKITRTSPDIKKRIDQYLSVVVPGITHVEAIDIGPYETLEFYYDNGQKFYANSMSDGTDSPLVGIEEPETALHPAAAGVLHDAIREASLKKQVIVTSHSPDLLDDPNLDPDSILVTTMENGSTRIAPLGNASREAIKTHLYTAGELLRMNQLTPEPLA